MLQNRKQKTSEAPSYMEFTRDNHFEFGYDGKPFCLRESPEQNFWVNYGRCKREVLDWRTECIAAAREIRTRTKKDIWVCLSGGIDSQVVVESFRYAKIPVRAAILRFKRDLNIHDIAWAVSYCEKNQVPYEFFEIDIEKFFMGGELMEIASQTYTVTPQFPSTMKLMQLVAKRGGFPVLGSAECYLEKSPRGWVMFEREKVASLYRYLMLSGIEGQAGFFQWNPEQMYSFLVDPLIKKMVDDDWTGIYSTSQVKHKIYEQYFELERRPKYTGFEKIRHLDLKLRVALENKFPWANQECRIDYHQLVKSLASRKSAQSNAERELEQLNFRESRG